MQYYRDVYGFDPVRDRIPLSGDLRRWAYYAEFPLENDPSLKQAGVKIGASVEVFDEVIKNSIIFATPKKRAAVNCIHTAILSTTPDQATDEKILEHARSTEFRPIQLVPEEHFASLKSYVAGIADIGIEQVMLASYESPDVNPETLPFGFNSMMQAQVIRALRQLVPKTTTKLIQDLFISLSKSVPREWFESRLLLFDEIYFRCELVDEFQRHLPSYSEKLSEDFLNFMFQDENLFENVDQNLQSPVLRAIATFYQDTSPEILEYLARQPPFDVPVTLGRIFDINYEIAKKLAPALKAKETVAFTDAVLLHKHVPQTVLQQKFASEDPMVWQIIASHPRTPDNYLAKIAREGSLELKALVAKNPAASEATLRQLCQYPDLGLLELVNKHPNATASICDYFFSVMNKSREEEVSILGTRVSKTDFEILGRLGYKSIELKEKLSCMEAGFIIRNGRVVGLSLGDSPIRQFPQEILSLTALESLYGYGTQLSYLPDLRPLKHLKVLDIMRAPISSLPPLPALETLSIYFSEVLRELPPQIGDLTSLRHLRVAYGKLVSVPPEIGNLVNLETLSLNDNALRCLPEELGYLKQLKSLQVEHNNLQALPNSVGALENLEDLNAGINQLRGLPAQIGRLKKLKSLRLKENRIETLPPEIGGCTGLKILEMSKNALRELPAELAQAHALERLEVHYNPLSRLPPSFATLENLEYVWIGSGHTGPGGVILDGVDFDDPALRALVGKGTQLRCAVGSNAFYEMNSLPEKRTEEKPAPKPEIVDAQVRHWLPPSGEIKHVVLALHGAGVGPETYTKVATHLIQTQCVVYSIEFPEIKDQLPPNAFAQLGFHAFARKPVYCWEEHLGPVKNFVLKLKAKHPGAPVTLLGHGMGGYFVLRLATHHPNLADSIIVISPFLTTPNFEGSHPSPDLFEPTFRPPSYYFQYPPQESIYGKLPELKTPILFLQLGNDDFADDYEMMGIPPPNHMLGDNAESRDYFNAIAAPSKLYLTQITSTLNPRELAPDPFTFLYRFEDILNKGLPASDMEQVLKTITQWIVAREGLLKPPTKLLQKTMDSPSKRQMFDPNPINNLFGMLENIHTVLKGAVEHSGDAAWKKQLEEFENIQKKSDASKDLFKLEMQTVDNPIEAEAFIRAQLERDPRQDLLWLMLGSLLAAQFRWEDALQAFTRAKDLDPTEPFCKDCIGITLDALGKEPYQGNWEIKDLINVFKEQTQSLLRHIEFTSEDDENIYRRECFQRTLKALIFHYYQKDPKKGEEAIEKMLSNCDIEQKIYFLNNIAWQLYSQRTKEIKLLELGKSLAARGVALAKKNNSKLLVNGLDSQACLASLLGEYEESKRLFEEAINVNRGGRINITWKEFARVLKALGDNVNYRKYKEFF